MIEVQDVTGITGIDLVFGKDIEKLLPEWNDIPEEFKDMRNRWHKVITDWFFHGLKNVKWTPKPGIVAEKAAAHINAIMSSWVPKHEHKEAGCAYLLSEFFDDVTYETIK